jgi:hypothetical protein
MDQPFLSFTSTDYTKKITPWLGVLRKLVAPEGIRYTVPNGSIYVCPPRRKWLVSECAEVLWCKPRTLHSEASPVRQRYSLATYD